MFVRRLIFVAAMSASLGLLSLTQSTHAAPAAAKYDLSGWHKSDYAVHEPGCRCAPLPRPGLQPDYQFYYDTPGYFPGFLPAAGLAPELDPPVSAGFSEGPLGSR
jgi:hypothetical protein